MKFHRHIWKVVNKDLYESPMDRLLRQGIKLTGPAAIPATQRAVYTLRCEICGTERLKEFYV